MLHDINIDVIMSRLTLLLFCYLPTTRDRPHLNQRTATSSDHHSPLHAYRLLLTLSLKIRTGEAVYSKVT